MWWMLLGMQHITQICMLLISRNNCGTHVPSYRDYKDENHTEKQFRPPIIAPEEQHKSRVMWRGFMNFIPIVASITINSIPCSNLYTSPRNILVHQCCRHAHNNCSPCTAQEPAIAILPSVPTTPCNFCTIFFFKGEDQLLIQWGLVMQTVIGASKSGVPSQLLDSQASTNHNPNTKGNQEKGAASDVSPRVLSQISALHDFSLQKTYCIPPIIGEMTATNHT